MLEKGGSVIKIYSGEIGLILVSLIWGSGFVYTQLGLNNGLTPFQLMTGRFFIGALLISVIFFKQIKKIDKKDIIPGVLLGGFLFVAFSFQTFGLQFTTSSKSAFLTASNVVIVPFIGCMLYKRKLDKISILSSLIALIGIGIISLETNFTIGIGDSLTLICAIGFAMHIFLTSQFTKKHNPIVLTCIQMITAFLLSLILQIIAGEVNADINISTMSSILFLGVFNTTICFLGQTICQTKVDETKTALILSTEAVFGMLFSVVIANEVITTKMIAGSLLIFIAIICAETKLKFLLKSGNYQNT
ncbi:transporter [[Clostridium] sordellii]|uniref:DMT family transporter n=1 Tax=Paraclostridium sordellii TaxID=1505 RepID=UPI0005E9045E|nr:DMT family transporter [Paeniclostridium sordellii]MDU2147512.1 DMT family transporter [Paeniclostridium sordellii]CEP39604.1 transporter [[Clostridium] sordellii] [Paeniclostridium sordellii]CEQ12848.1 transporter [[Clostridium] sordellii] [Paeniclostridium sordellii]CEQ29512.1 transporter [[Clostridium] sordellii] [Paeniclostridium sordellii]